jgi:tetratricopeptide (TPR) repeat protein
LLFLLCVPFAAAQSVDELYAEAKAAQSRNDLATAIGKYQEILRLSPKLGPAYNNLGMLYFRQHEFRKAADVLEQGLKVDPSMTSASALLGISLYEVSDYARARPRLEAAVRANPNDNNARLFLVKDLTQLGDADAAAPELQQLARRQLNPGSSAFGRNDGSHEQLRWRRGGTEKGCGHGAAKTWLAL